MSMILDPKDTCPRCGLGVPNNAQRGEYPGALSRWTREPDSGPIYVCSECGRDEAMIQWMASLAGADPQAAVHPDVLPWRFLPQEA